MRYQKSCVSRTSGRDNGTLPVVIKLAFMKLRYTEYGAGAQTRWLQRTQEGTKKSREEYLEESNKCGRCDRKLQHVGITGVWSEKDINCEK